MEGKRFTRRSYLALITNILLSLSIIGLDFISINVSEKLGVPLIFIFLIVSTIFTFISFTNKKERRMLAVFSSILWVINTSIIILFLWIGANFAP
ncbi:hypothetical protein [Schinkia azotoformans]|uniref:hypothetical protein n=1 Tax=Schinkia azotoformans TaxID=1454 RepID=UPI002DB83493|nr:hypothetical protein [Schinkia azotoformans]MEC1698241.1 hypothetical protein [Schinkia azotoformans]MEC1716479.1 hypothetical protein [Schinkia azotoformans]MEC1739925.1 hypothetical protein [Schinkia azotoformans]MEC1746787.1 hypothetical protein [Schinkia azotoformans]MEC1758792.1 hypothetical protein [Schinkia azotoformans]